MSDSKFLDSMVDVVKKQFGANRPLQCGAVAVLTECVVGSGDFAGKPVPAVLVKWEVPAAEQPDGTKCKGTTMLAEEELRLNFIGDNVNAPLSGIIKSRIDQTMTSFDDLIRLKPIALKPPKSYRVRPFTPIHLNITSETSFIRGFDVNLECTDCRERAVVKCGIEQPMTAKALKACRDLGWTVPESLEGFILCPDCSKALKPEMPK